MEDKCGCWTTWEWDRDSRGRVSGLSMVIIWKVSRILRTLTYPGERFDDHWMEKFFHLMAWKWLKQIVQRFLWFIGVVRLSLRLLLRPHSTSKNVFHGMTLSFGLDIFSRLFHGVTLDAVPEVANHCPSSVSSSVCLKRMWAKTLFPPTSRPPLFRSRIIETNDSERKHM